MLGVSPRKLLLPAAAAFGLFLVVLGALIAVPHFLCRREYAPIEVSQDELDEINDARYGEWFREWCDETHPTLLSVVPGTAPSVDDYAARLAEARESYALSLSLEVSPDADAFTDWQRAVRTKAM